MSRSTMEFPQGAILQYPHYLLTIRKCARRGCQRYVCAIDNGCSVDCIDDAVTDCICDKVELGCDRHRKTLVCKKVQKGKPEKKRLRE